MKLIFKQIDKIYASIAIFLNYNYYLSPLLSYDLGISGLNQFDRTKNCIL